MLPGIRWGLIELKAILVDPNEAPQNDEDISPPKEYSFPSSPWKKLK